MKLSMWTLCDYLIKNGFRVEELVSEGLPCISRISQSSARSYSAGYAEVFRSGRNVHVVNEMDCLIVKDADVVDVINVLGEAIDHYTQWERELYECILGHGSLQELLDIAKKVFERPMFIKNDAAKTLAITHGYSNVHPFWDKMETSSDEPVPDFELVSAVSSDPDYKMAFLERYPSIRSSPSYGAMVLHANVFVNDRRSAEIVVLENGFPFNKGEVHLMNTFAELVAKYVNSDAHVFETASDVTVSLETLLEDGKVDKETFNNIKRYMGITEGEEMCLIVIEGEDRMDSPALSVLREKLVNQLKDAAVIQFSGRIVVLRMLKKFRYNEFVEDFKKRIPKEGFCWGVSYEFTRIEDVPYYYKQTCDVLDKAAFDTRNYVTAYEVASEMISELCEKNELSRTLIHPDLRRLENADIRDNTEYCETLFYYLLCGGNFTDAAKIMVLHRNTLIYRVNKIREIMHSNLDDMSNRKLLLYSYLLLNKDY